MRHNSIAVLLSCALHLGLGAAFWILNSSRSSSTLASRSPILAYRVGGAGSPVKRGSAKKLHPSTPATQPALIRANHSESEDKLESHSISSGSGSSSSDEAGLASNFAQELRERIEARLRYPLSLQRRGVSGSVKAQVVIQAPDGTLLEAAIIESSGHSSLDELAIEAIRASAPFPLPPTQGPGKLTWSIPIEFRLGSR